MTRFGPTTVGARLTLWYTLVLSVPLVAFALISYIIFERTLLSRTDAFSRDALAVFARELEAERRQIPTITDAIRATVFDMRFRDLDVVVLDGSGTVVAMSAPLGDTRTRARRAMPVDSTRVLAALREHGTVHARQSTVTGARERYRIFTQPHESAAQKFVLGTVYPLTEVEATLQRIRQLFLFAIPVLIAVAAAGGYFLAKRSFAPVSAMAARAAEIGAATLHERLPVAADDELGALARVLNELLDRLEDSFAQQRRFMTDASHELRTPAAILQAEADVTLARDSRSESEFRQSMTIVQDAARRLNRIVDDIFLLARSDAGHLVGQADELYLEDVVHETARAIRPLADTRGVRIQLGDVVEAPFRGDAHLLGRVLLNLLDNAIKHSPAGSTVNVNMSRTDAWYEIEVVDAGSGIPLAAQERIFERFFRGDRARVAAENSATSGTGLGLAIARRITEVYGGHLELVTSRPGRTVFRVRLPVNA
jgi:heavy metal sensor kinase